MKNNCLYRIIICIFALLIITGNLLHAIEEKEIDFDIQDCTLLKSDFFKQVKEFTFETSPIAIRFNKVFFVLTQDGKINKCSNNGHLPEIKDFKITSPVSFDCKNDNVVILHNNGRTISGFNDAKKLFEIEILDQIPFFIKPHKVIFIDDNNILVMDKYSCYGSVYSSNKGKFNGVIIFQKPVNSEKYIIEDIKYYKKHFYLVIQNQDRIMKFNRNGKYIRSIAGSGFDNGRLNYPSGIGFDKCGSLYIADYWNNRIVKYLLKDNNQHDILKQFDTNIYPSSIVIASNTLFAGVIFPWNNKMILYDMDQMKEIKACFKRKDFQNTALLLKSLHKVSNDKQKIWITYYLSYIDYLNKNFKIAFQNLSKLLNKDLQRDRLFYKIYRIYNIIRFKDMGK